MQQKPPDLDEQGNPLVIKPPDLDEGGNLINEIIAKPPDIKEEPKKEEPKKKDLSFAERALSLALAGPNDPMSILRKGAELFRPQIESRLGQITEQEPGILNPNPEQNPLILKSLLPETKADPGMFGTVKHELYDKLIRPMASPAGAYSTLMGSNPADISEGSLAKSGLNKIGTEITSDIPKPKIKPSILDKSGREIAPAQTVIPDRPNGPWDNNGIMLGDKPEIQTPINKLLSALDTAKPLNKEQAAIYSAERAERFGKVAGVKTPGLAGHYERLGKLKGEHTKVQTEPLKLEQPDIDSLIDTISKHPDLMEGQKLNADSGLIKILSGSVPQDAEIALLEKVFGADVVSQIRAKLPKIDVKRSLISEAVNFPRAIQSSMDLSAPFRQGLGLIHTGPWWKSWGTMVKAFGSEKSYRGTMDSILEHPNFKQVRNANGQIQPSLAQKSGLKLTDLTELSKREESMASTWAEKVPLVRNSNRAYVSFLNKVRADNFNNLVKDAEKLYQTAKSTGSARRGFLKESFDNPELLNPKTNIKLTKDLASFVNNASGRGDLGKLEQSAVALNGAFFSPRLIASRLQYMNPKNYIYANPMVRKQYLKSLVAMAGTWTSLATMAKMGGADVSLDPNSADFGKIKLGNTRLDPAGGFQQYLVLMSKLASGKYTTSTSGREHDMGTRFGDKTRTDTLTDFVANKLAPVPSFAFRAGSATSNRPFELGDESIKLFTPMLIQDLSEILQEDPSLLPTLIPAAIGMGVQSYDRGPGKRMFGEAFPRESDIRFPIR